VVIGVKDQLRKKIMKVALNLYIRGHASIQNSYKRLKNMFYYPIIKKLRNLLANVTSVNKLNW
jgi:hypothetical protein